MGADLLTVLVASLGVVFLGVAGVYLVVRRLPRPRWRQRRYAPLPGERADEVAEGEPEEEPAKGELEPEPERERSIDFSRRGAAAGSEIAERAPEPVRFTVYHPLELVPERWARLLAYVHLAGAWGEVDRDRQKVLAGEPGGHRARSEDAGVAIRREALIRIVPELTGCRFNPPEASVLWLEDWHGVVFRLQAHRDAPGFAPDRAVNGRVAFYVESVLAGELPIGAWIGGREEVAEGARQYHEPILGRSSPAFDRVFASYSHRDGEIVEALGRAYRALGMEFLRDVEALRSGEQWSPRLLGLIESADVFQLYWSENASGSQYVAQEWRHALDQRRDRFIRSVYWRRPMPEPPAELASIHFAFLPGFDRG